MTGGPTLRQASSVTRLYWISTPPVSSRPCSELCHALRARAAIMRLAPGGDSGSHDDVPLAARGFARVHLPVRGGRNASYWVEGADVSELLVEGALAFVDTLATHRVTNDGPASRDAFVVDCVADTELAAALGPGTPPPRLEITAISGPGVSAAPA